jgi:hypothetical protein
LLKDDILRLRCLVSHVGIILRRLIDLRAALGVITILMIVSCTLVGEGRGGHAMASLSARQVKGVAVFCHRDVRARSGSIVTLLSNFTAFIHVDMSKARAVGHDEASN